MWMGVQGLLVILNGLFSTFPVSSFAPGIPLSRHQNLVKKSNGNKFKLTDVKRKEIKYIAINTEYCDGRNDFFKFVKRL